MPGRALLHRVHHASVHHQRRPLPIPAVPHEIRKEQIQAPRHPQDRVRLAAVYRHESTSVPDVLQGR